MITIFSNSYTIIPKFFNLLEHDLLVVVGAVVVDATVVDVHDLRVVAAVVVVALVVDVAELPQPELPEPDNKMEILFICNWNEIIGKTVLNIFNKK